jgi:DNA repair ATPase RecN
LDIEAKVDNQKITPDSFLKICAKNGVKNALNVLMSLTDKVKGFQGYKGVSDPENLSSSELKVQNHILKN